MQILFYLLHALDHLFHTSDGIDVQGRNLVVHLVHLLLLVLDLLLQFLDLLRSIVSNLPVGAALAFCRELDLIGRGIQVDHVAGHLQQVGRRQITVGERHRRRVVGHGGQCGPRGDVSGSVLADQNQIDIRDFNTRQTGAIDWHPDVPAGVRSQRGNLCVALIHD